MSKSKKNHVPKMPWLLHPEVQDAVLFAWGGVVIMACWFFLLQWHPGDALVHHDAVLWDLPILRELQDAGGDMSKLVYRPQWLGGTAIDATGVAGAFRILSQFHVGLQTQQSIFIVIMQMISSFLGIKLAAALAGLLDYDRENIAKASSAKDWVFKSAQVIVFAFAPTLAWELTYGHWIMVLGTLVFWSVATVAICYFARQATAVLCVIAGLTICTDLQLIHQQANLYAWVFGAPLVLGVLGCLKLTGKLDGDLNRKHLLKALLLGLGVLLAGIALAWGDLSVILSRVKHGEIARAEGNVVATYSYLTSTLRDWVSSLPWGFGLISNQREEMFQPAKS